MPKDNLDITKQVMARIESGRVSMKPGWYFVVGSVVLVTGLAALAVLLIFLFMLVSFSLRTHGPMGQYRFEQILSGFPWWTIPAALAGLIIGIVLLKKYDFSYRRNFVLLIIGLVLALISAGFVADRLDLISYFPRTGLMRQLYQRYDGGYRFRRTTPSDQPASTGFPRRLNQTH